jgi:hypothetical protein
MQARPTWGKIYTTNQRIHFHKRIIDSGATHGCAEAGAGIPAGGDRETVSTARGAVASDDVGEVVVGLGEDPRVQEAERGLAIGETGFVDEGDGAGH